MKDGKSTRLVLPCTDDYDNFMCFLCHKYVESGHTLYRHMCFHTSSEWREVLPETLENCSEIIVRKMLFDSTSDSDEEASSDDGLIMNEGECNGSAVDLTLTLPQWNAKGKAKDKRGRQVFKNESTKKLKVADVKDNEVVPEGGGLSAKKDVVVFDFDLNEVMSTTEDEACAIQ